MSKKEITTREQSVPKTIKVSTLAIIVGYFAVAVGFFISGYFFNSYDNQRVKQEAVRLNSELSVKELKTNQ